jgi:hypothetical protein
MKSAEPCPSQNPEPLLVADGGVSTLPTSGRDPYEMLDDLMVVVEALCPRWPQRETFKAEGIWLL